MARTPKKPIEVRTIRHDEAKRPNIPTAELETVMSDEDKSPIQLAYERRNRDLDPQLVWRGKDEQDWSDLIVQAPPLYIQEKVHPKVLIDDLMRQSRERKEAEPEEAPDLFADFNGLPDAEATTEFYAHDANWTNRMILGDSLSVMASLAEREGLRGKVQCIYIDPPYGIKFNSNFQWSTTSRDVKDGKAEHISREPEQVKAFRDTWRDGIHSYLTYLRDRLTVARDLLHESGSIFVQIGDENVHRVRALLDEVFGEDNFVSEINFKKTGFQASKNLPNNSDILLFYAKNISSMKFRTPYISKMDSSAFVGQDIWFDDRKGNRRRLKRAEREGLSNLNPDNIFRHKPPEGAGSAGRDERLLLNGRIFRPKEGKHFSTHEAGMRRLKAADRFLIIGNSLRYIEYLSGFSVTPLTNLWTDTVVSGFSDPQLYVVQTSNKVVERCIQMVSDPGDLILDPTCGSGTAAFVAEHWGRRWITIDTSRVALALARVRVMGARYPYYHLRDTAYGIRKEADLRREPPAEEALSRVDRSGHRPDIRQGFVYERVPHIMLRDIANNAEIDVIWEKWQEVLEPQRDRLNTALGRSGERASPSDAGDSGPWEDWEIPREAEEGWPEDAKTAHASWWEGRIARQTEIDASIAAKADYEYLYDKPYTDTSKIRVAGPFTVESLSPHRVLAVDADDELVDELEAAEGRRERDSHEEADFAEMILENLNAAGVQQAHKEDRIGFTALTGWPGNFICAEGRYREGGEEGDEKRAGVFIGPEFGTVARADLVAAAREAADAGFDVLIACAFNFDAHSAEFDKLGRIPVLKARMNADLHMADDLATTGKGNLFVIFGEPDIDIEDVDDDRIRVKINGVDVFHPQTGSVTSSGPEGIACWFIDTDYNEESFFVRHAYFLGANDPYKALKTTLKAEIDEEAWETLHSDTSRPFPRPETGRIAVKVINHLGDEVMKVFGV